MSDATPESESYHRTVIKTRSADFYRLARGAAMAPQRASSSLAGPTGQIGMSADFYRLFGGGGDPLRIVVARPERMGAQRTVLSKKANKVKKQKAQPCGPSSPVSVVVWSMF